MERVALRSIEPGKPNQNAYVESRMFESFNGRLRAFRPTSYSATNSCSRFVSGWSGRTAAAADEDAALVSSRPLMTAVVGSARRSIRSLQHASARRCRDLRHDLPPNGETAQSLATVDDYRDRFTEKNHETPQRATVAFGLEGRCSIQLSYGRVLTR